MQNCAIARALTHQLCNEMEKKQFIECPVLKKKLIGESSKHFLMNI